MGKRKFGLLLLRQASLKTLRLRKVGFRNFVEGTKQQLEKTFCALKIDYFPSSTLLKLYLFQRFYAKSTTFDNMLFMHNLSPVNNFKN